MSYLIYKVDGGLQVESEVNELPLDAFPLVLLLLENEHGVVEQLLQLLVGVVDAELLKRVELKDFKTGHIENADEGGALPLGPVQGPVQSVDQPAEHALVARLADRLNGKLGLLLGLRLGHKVTAHLDARLQECLGHLRHLRQKVQIWQIKIFFSFFFLLWDNII
jgi:hypothetical protein